jgi:hypothetical protein
MIAHKLSKVLITMIKDQQTLLGLSFHQQTMEIRFELATEPAVKALIALIACISSPCCRPLGVPGTKKVKEEIDVVYFNNKKIMSF